MKNRPQPECTPVAWWRVGVVWLVIGAPAVAVVSSLVAAGLAVIGADTVLTTDAAKVPAIKARNHAAAPGR
jgi:uncharacterized protein